MLFKQNSVQNPTISCAGLPNCAQNSNGSVHPASDRGTMGEPVHRVHFKGTGDRTKAVFSLYPRSLVQLR